MEKQAQQPSNKPNRLKRGIFGSTLAGLALLAAGCGVSIKSSDKPNSMSPSIETIAKELNSTSHTASNVTIEQGYDVPLQHSKPNQPIAAENPIKLSPNTYAYVSAVSNSGKVSLRSVSFNGSLLPVASDNEYAYSKEYYHEVTSPITVVYDTYPSSDKTTTSRYYYVTEGDISGNTTNFVKIPPGARKLKEIMI